MEGGTGITDAVLDDIKQRTDLGELIASYGVDIRHSGSSLVACCPFHNEKTPSFNINVGKGFYYCFGCGESGDAIKFVQKFEGLSFIDAVKKLAEKCGIEIKESYDPTAVRRKRLYALMAELAEFYRRCLVKMRDAEPAREYLKRRKLDDATCESWTIGYAPEGAAVIRKWAEKYGYTDEELAAAGVVILPDQPDGRPYHRFSGRLMFTIRDRMQRVVGFSGRQLKEDKHSGKYVNSPATEIFKKSNVLFGFDRAQREIVRAPNQEMIACEGQIDCIRLHMSGFKTAVASQGTAFTEEHAHMVKRVANSAVLMFDDDGAGRKATVHVAGMLLAMDMPVRVVSLPDGDDPDSFLCKHGPKELQALIDNAESIISFQCRVERAKEKSPDTLGAVSRVTKAVLATVAKCPSAVLRAAMIDETAKALSLPVAALADELQKAIAAASLRVARRTPAASIPQTGDVSPDIEVYGDSGGTEPVPVQDEEIPVRDAHKAIPPPKCEISLMEFLLGNEYDGDLDVLMEHCLPQEALAHDFTRRFLAVWRDECAKGEDCFAAFADSLEGDERVWFDMVLLGAAKTQASTLAPVEILQDHIRELWRAEFERRRGALPASDDDATIVSRMELTAAIKKIRQVPWGDVAAIVSSCRQCRP